jgi:hypothetical protein
LTPGTLVLGPLLGEDQPALVVLLVEDQGFDRLSHGDDASRVDVAADRKFFDRDETFGLVSDVDHGAVGVDRDDGPLDDVTFLELNDGLGNGSLEVVGDVVGKRFDAGGDDHLRAPPCWWRFRGLVLRLGGFRFSGFGFGCWLVGRLYRRVIGFDGHRWV